MNTQQQPIFGIDLGTTYSCIAYIDEHGKATVIPNQEHQLTTPSIVLFEDTTRIVGDEAKNNALINPGDVVEMVKRHIGEAHWHFQYGDKEYSPEEISSYILRKLVTDAQQVLGIPVTDVVITCPAYFGIAQREATARAGEIAGLRVHEIISEPTAAAIAYGLQQVQDQVVLVYDLGGGTFDVTIIAIKKESTTVIATGGDHHLGGRDWDEAIVKYLTQQWQEQANSKDDPLDDPETLQDLWLKAEKAKWALTARTTTRVIVAHAGRRFKVELAREKFDELTDSLIKRTMLFTKMVIDAAQTRGYNHIDQIVLVGGSTRMPQVAQRLDHHFHIPYRLFDPDEAVAKGAALYGQRLLLQKNIRTKAHEILKTSADISRIAASTASIVSGRKPPTSRSDEEPVRIPPAVLRQAQSEIARALGIEEAEIGKLAATTITNVASHSFGIIATIDYGTPRVRKVISNLVKVNTPLPTTQKRVYGTIEEDQDVVELEIMENAEDTWIVEAGKFQEDAEIGKITITLPEGLPEDAPIEVTFELNTQGRLVVTGREPQANTSINATFETKGILSKEEVEDAKARVQNVTII